MFDSRTVKIFNEMQGDYDQITDLWYSWLFCRLHYLISKKVISQWRNEKKVLDIGCGTGFQSFLYAKAGAEVLGIDISDKLVELANQKKAVFDPSEPISFFEAKYEFVTAYDKKIEAILAKAEYPYRYTPPVFRVGDAQHIDAESNYFDHINCCGSTFSFIPDYPSAIAELKRCLKPGGTFVLEVEAKNNLDLFWPLLDSTLLFGRLEYDTSFKEATQQVFGQVGQHIQVEYPFGDVKNPVYMNISLYKKNKLIRELNAAGLRVSSYDSIHSVTNLIPSTILDSEKPSASLKAAFSTLAAIEEKMPFYVPGCSLVLFGHKT